MRQPFVQSWQGGVHWHSCLECRSEEQLRLAVVGVPLGRCVAAVGMGQVAVVVEVVAERPLVADMENRTVDTGVVLSQVRMPNATRQHNSEGHKGRDERVRRKATEVSTRVLCALGYASRLTPFYIRNASSYMGWPHTSEMKEIMRHAPLAQQDHRARYGAAGVRQQRGLSLQKRER